MNSIFDSPLFTQLQGPGMFKDFLIAFVTLTFRLFRGKRSRYHLWPCLHMYLCDHLWSDFYL